MALGSRRRSRRAKDSAAKRRTKWLLWPSSVPYHPLTSSRFSERTPERNLKM